MSNVPLARARLEALDAVTSDPELRATINDILPLLRREAHKHRRARPTAAPMTPRLAEDIAAYARNNPSMSNRQVGAAFGVDGGRVSEVLAGQHRHQ